MTESIEEYRERVYTVETGKDAFLTNYTDTKFSEKAVEATEEYDYIDQLKMEKAAVTTVATTVSRSTNSVISIGSDDAKDVVEDYTLSKEDKIKSGYSTPAIVVRSKQATANKVAEKKKQDDIVANALADWQEELGISEVEVTALDVNAGVTQLTEGVQEVITGTQEGIDEAIANAQERFDTITENLTGTMLTSAVAGVIVLGLVVVLFIYMSTRSG